MPNYSLLDENGVVRLRHPIYTDEKGVQRGGGAVFVQGRRRYHW